MDNFSRENRGATSASGLLDNLLFDGKAEKIRICFQAKILHDAIFVEGNGARGDVQYGRGFLHGVALGEELKNFTLSGSEYARRFGTRFTKWTLLQPLLHCRGDIFSTA